MRARVSPVSSPCVSHLASHPIPATTSFNSFIQVRQGPNDSALPYAEDLLRAEAYAQELCLGMYTKDSSLTSTSVRKLPDPSDPGVELEDIKGRPQAAIVEAVLNGSCLRLALIGSDQYLTVFLAGELKITPFKPLL